MFHLQVKELRSDKGTNFIAADRELKEALAWNQDKISKAIQHEHERKKWTFKTNFTTCLLVPASQ